MPNDKPYTVSEINKKISEYIQSNSSLKEIWIQGEISNFSIGPTGHLYFSLKDSNSSLKCTFFLNRHYSYKGNPLKDGMEIRAFGNIQVYEPRGEYSFNVMMVEEVGKGNIYMYVEKLRRELSAKGIFNPDHKKPIPFLPKTLGIATSPNGAAIEDILKIALSNYPNINILIAPCIVQGNEAVPSIVEAIQALNDPRWAVDVIIAGRGGGSYEDLMPFNEEEVVMAFYNSRVPIISAVGHEIDKVLSDYAADVAAPTPTAAAKIAVPDIKTLLEKLNSFERRITIGFQNLINLKKDKVYNLTNRRSFIDPMYYLENSYIQLDDLTRRIIILGNNLISGKKELFAKKDQLNYRIEQYMERLKNRLKLSTERLENFSPLGTLSRGYSIVRNQKKNIVQSIEQVNLNEELEVILHKGKLNVQVLSKEDFE